MSVPIIYYAVRYCKSGEDVLISLPNSSCNDSEYALLVQMTEAGAVEESAEAIAELQSWDELVDLLNKLGEDADEDWLIDKADFAELPDMEEIEEYRLYGLQEDQGEYELAVLSVQRSENQCSCSLFSSEDSDPSAAKVVKEIERLFEVDD